MKVISYLVFLVLVASILVGCEEKETPTEENENIEIINNPPTVEITNPDEGDIFIQGQPIRIDVDVTDEDPYMVNYYVDGELIESDTTNLFYYFWNSSEAALTNHAIRVEVFDSILQMDEDELQIEIVAHAVPEFTSDTVVFHVDGAIQFTDLSVGHINSWEWDFGDGYTSTLQNPAHSYSEIGTYTVSLTITDDYQSETITKENYITINEADYGNGVADIDGNFYQSVIIGEQEWMAENLKTTTYKDGTPITLVEGDANWWSYNEGAYSWYQDDISYKNVFGGYYNWYASNSSKICPEGWRLPVEEDISILWNYLIEAGYSGQQSYVLKSKNMWVFSEGLDLYGFNALPADYRLEQFYSYRQHAYFWRVGDYDDTYAWGWGMDDFHYEIISGAFRQKKSGLSVRCIKE
jgi:uncharacterized protein (TIGR02145 family)